MPISIAKFTNGLYMSPKNKLKYDITVLDQKPKFHFLTKNVGSAER